MIVHWLLPKLSKFCCSQWQKISNWQHFGFSVCASLSCQLPSNIWYKEHQILKLKCFFVSSYIYLCPIHWSQVLSREWKCSWSSADMRCSNYTWVINNSTVNYDASYIKGLTALALYSCWTAELQLSVTSPQYQLTPGAVGIGSVT